MEKPAEMVSEYTEQDEDVVADQQEVAETVEPEEPHPASGNPSEYDSADGSYSDEEPEQQEHRQRSEHDSDTDDRSVVLEREDGDGQESAVNRKVDDDEDKKNPQYIPKRGTFYEHDDRTADDDGEDVEDKEKLEKDGKKKIWTDKKEKWNHDKFNDNEQAPKSRSELVAIYGYDIRNEDGPPRARRRRRYGRGPNKYTRNWEDEDAYSKPPTVVNKKVTKKPNRATDNEAERQNLRNSDDANTSASASIEDQSERPPSYEQANQSNPPRHQDPRDARPGPGVPTEQRLNNKNQRVGTGRVVKPNREIKDSDYRGFTKPRQFATKAPRDMPREREGPPQQNYGGRRMPDIEKDMGRMSLQDQGYGKMGGKQHLNINNNNNRQTSVPPRLQGEQKGPKRYSSIRQRSLPESVTPPFNQQQHNYYGNADYSHQNQVLPNQQPPPQMMQHPGTQMLPNPAQMPTIPPPPLAAIPQQVPVTSTPMPPQFGTPFPQPPPQFLQPAPPPFIPQQAAPMINFVQGQPQFAPPQAPYPGYQQTFVPVTQPAEIYQPPGGITYYSAQDQQAAQRAALQKRPKAAIPIVPPPPLEPRGRGRSNNDGQSPGATEMGTLESITETGNNYEDVVVQQ